MVNNEQDWEYGLRTEGHGTDGETGGPVVLGENGFHYQVSGKNWGQLPDGVVYQEGTAVAVDEKDRVYVFNRGTIPMLVFDTDGNLLRTWGEGVFANPHGVTIAPDGTVFCVDNGDSTVRQFTPEGELLMMLGVPHKPSPKMSGDPFSVPAHVAFDRRTGEFYVADGYSNARVHKYSPDGKLLFSWGESGTGDGQFNIVHNVEVDSDGWVYIADRENHRIQVFSSGGKYETQWGNLSRAAAIWHRRPLRRGAAVHWGVLLRHRHQRHRHRPRPPRDGDEHQGQGAGPCRARKLRRPVGPLLFAPRYSRGFARRPLRGRGLLDRLRQAHEPAPGASLHAEAGPCAGLNAQPGNQDAQLIGYSQRFPDRRTNGGQRTLFGRAVGHHAVVLDGYRQPVSGIGPAQGAASPRCARKPAG